jgi:hypothetical protein
MKRLKNKKILTRLYEEDNVYTEMQSSFDSNTNDDDSVFETAKLFETIKEIIDKAKLFDSKPIFDSICYNCGKFLFGLTGKGCKQLAKREVTENDIEIVKMFKEHPVPSTMYTNQKKGKCFGRYFSCPKCKDGPSKSI